MSAPESKELNPAGYMPQLDALRAFAVGAVLVHHLLDPELLPEFIVDLSPGLLGVKLFFVLSGFLITGILLRARPGPGDSAWHVARQFYMRRFLRIFPLYYFVIGVMLLLGVQDVKDHVWSLLTYTFNFDVAFQGWYPGTVAHFWSLAVEEQFYLFWPFLILFAPRGWLFPGTILMIALGPLYRVLAIVLELNPVAYYTVTFASLDALGIGALAAILAGGRPAPSRLRSVLSRYVAPSAAAAAAALFVLEDLFDAALLPYAAFFETALALLFVWAVAAASSGVKGPIGGILTLKPLRYCGRIAYGIYVYHVLVRQPVFVLGNAAGLTWALGDPLNFAVTTLVTIGVAALSWHVMEAPINALKDRFAYSRLTPRKAPAPAE